MRAIKVIAIILALAAVTGCVIEPNGRVRPVHVILR
jgi:hypothetical protein